MVRDHEHDPACAVAHGEAPGEAGERTLLAVFASPVADFLLRYAADVGYRGVLLEPATDRAAAKAGGKDLTVVTAPPAGLDSGVDVVVTDHHRPSSATYSVICSPTRSAGSA